MITIMVVPTTRRDPELAEGELRALLEGLLQAGDHERLVETLVGLYGELSRENDRLRLRILELTRRVHGRSSEKIDPNARRKALEELREREFAQQAADQPEAAADEPAAPKPPTPKAPEKPRKPHPGRTPLPTQLPREERRHALAEADRLCECCERPKQRIREEVAERLEYAPSRFYVIRDEFAAPGQPRVGVLAGLLRGALDPIEALDDVDRDRRVERLGLEGLEEVAAHVHEAADADCQRGAAGERVIALVAVGLEVAGAALEEARRVLVLLVRRIVIGGEAAIADVGPEVALTRALGLVRVEDQEAGIIALDDPRAQDRLWIRRASGCRVCAAARIHSIKVFGDSVTPSRAKIFD